MRAINRSIDLISDIILEIKSKSRGNKLDKEYIDAFEILKGKLIEFKHKENQDVINWLIYFKDIPFGSVFSVENYISNTIKDIEHTNDFSFTSK